MKKNLILQDSAVFNTSLSVSSYELPQLIEKLSILIWEIEQTPFRKVVHRLAKSADALIDDHLNPKFWSQELTETIGYQTLHLCQYREKMARISYGFGLLEKPLTISSGRDRR